MAKKKVDHDTLEHTQALDHIESLTAALGFVKKGRDELITENDRLKTVLKFRTDNLCTSEKHLSEVDALLRQSRQSLANSEANFKEIERRYGHQQKSYKKVVESEQYFRDSYRKYFELWLDAAEKGFALSVAAVVMVVPYLIMGLGWLSHHVSINIH